VVHTVKGRLVKQVAFFTNVVGRHFWCVEALWENTDCFTQKEQERHFGYDTANGLGVFHSPLRASPVRACLFCFVSARPRAAFLFSGDRLVEYHAP
jgi:hypothetical protein